MKLFNIIKKTINKLNFKDSKYFMEYYAPLDHLIDEFNFHKEKTIYFAEKAELPKSEYIPIIIKNETIASNALLKTTYKKARQIIINDIDSDNKYRDKKYIEEIIEDIIENTKSYNIITNQHNNYQKLFSDKISDIKKRIKLLLSNPEMAKAEYFLEKSNQAFNKKTSRF